MAKPQPCERLHALALSSPEPLPFHSLGRVLECGALLPIHMRHNMPVQGGQGWQMFNQRDFAGRPGEAVWPIV